MLYVTQLKSLLFAPFAVEPVFLPAKLGPELRELQQPNNNQESSIDCHITPKVIQTSIYQTTVTRQDAQVICAPDRLQVDTTHHLLKTRLPPISLSSHPKLHIEKRIRFRSRRERCCDHRRWCRWIRGSHQSRTGRVEGKLQLSIELGLGIKMLT